MTDFVTTGDGLIAALQFLSAMVKSGQSASRLSNVFEPLPQKLENVRFKQGSQPLEADLVKQAIADGETTLGDKGRLLIRKSGTEPLVRVMGECEDAVLLDRVVTDIASAVRSAG
jgi:phosphoglucosamine mutase